MCDVNGWSIPKTTLVPKAKWRVDACAYYRWWDSDRELSREEKPQLNPTIRICLEHCGHPCGDAMSRNWTWPCSTTDREPYGVLAHELGHHVDWLCSQSRGSYGGDFSIGMRKASGEKPISGYCPNDWEWFAEMFRVFATNPGLLLQLRPHTYGMMASLWKPVVSMDWRIRLRDNVPDRVVTALINKGAI